MEKLGLDKYYEFIRLKGIKFTKQPNRGIEPILFVLISRLLKRSLAKLKFHLLQTNKCLSITMDLSNLTEISQRINLAELVFVPSPPIEVAPDGTRFSFYLKQENKLIITN